MSENGRVRVAGTWELGWNTPIKELELWEYPLRDMGVEEFHMFPVSGIASSAVIEHASFESILASNDGFTRVYVDEGGAEDLEQFVHPENAVYIFGKASLSLLRSYGSPADRSVKITTKLNSGLLWPHQACCIVLYDRMRKTWP